MVSLMIRFRVLAKFSNRNIRP